MTTFLRGTLAAIALGLAPAHALQAQAWGTPPTAEQCAEWTAGLAAGGEAALNAVTYGYLPGCPAAAPAALEQAVRAARASADSAYLGQLAAVAGNVKDPAVFAAALEVAADGRASSRARVMGLLVAVAHLGSSQDIDELTRAQLFSEALPATGVCGFEAAATDPAIDNPLASDAERRAARVIDGILYAKGEPALVQNLARCARSSISIEIVPQVDVRMIKVDYVCGNRFRVQNHTGTSVTLAVSTTAANGTSVTEDHVIPAKGGWTQFDTPAAGSIQVAYDGTPVATVANTGRGCGGG
jgi:hypothetical protein